MMQPILVVVGLVIGGIIGYFLCSLMVIAKIKFPHGLDH